MKEEFDISTCIGLESTINWLIEINKEAEGFAEWAAMPEDDAIPAGHHGFGTWIRNTLLLWDSNSAMSKYFNDLGIFHPDDMSGILMTVLHRTLNNVPDPVEIKFQISKYIEYWNRVDPDINKGEFRK